MSSFCAFSPNCLTKITKNYFDEANKNARALSLSIISIYKIIIVLCFWDKYNLVPSINNYFFYKVQQIDKSHALAFQTVNLMQLSPICQS
jgi:hypothetical protein